MTVFRSGNDLAAVAAVQLLVQVAAVAIVVVAVRGGGNNHIFRCIDAICRVAGGFQRWLLLLLITARRNFLFRSISLSTWRFVAAAADVVAAVVCRCLS